MQASLRSVPILLLLALLSGLPGAHSAFVEKAKLVPDLKVPESAFGWYGLSVSNGTILVGRYTDGENGTDPGSVFVYTGSGSNWTQQTKLRPPDTEPGYDFGISTTFLTTDSNKALVGCARCFGAANRSGAVYEFTRNITSGIWTRTGKFFASDGKTYDDFGFKIATDGDTMIVGAPYRTDGRGGAYAFVNNGGTGGVWTEQAQLLPTFNVPRILSSRIGFTVAISGDIAALGSAIINARGRRIPGGAVFITERSGDTWSDFYMIEPEIPLFDYNFGIRVSLSGTTMGVGSAGRTLNLVNGLYYPVGAVHVYQRASAGDWTQVADLRQPHLLKRAGSSFGFNSVVVKNDKLFTSALLDFNDHPIRQAGRGAAYVYQSTDGGTTWNEQQKLLASDGGESDQFGAEIAYDGKTLVVGAHNSNIFTGAVYVFE